MVAAAAHATKVVGVGWHRECVVAVVVVEEPVAVLMWWHGRRHGRGEGGGIVGSCQRRDVVCQRRRVEETVATCNETVEPLLANVSHC